jgi:hypothetical protein
MKKHILLSFIILFMLSGLKAQFESIEYNYEKNWFGENQALPAEKSWLLNGNLPDNVNMVELAIFRPGKIDKGALYISNYRLADGNSARRFSIPVNKNLQGNEEYTLVLRYFKNATPAEVKRLANEVTDALRAYLDLSTVAGRNRIDLAKHPDLMIQDLNQIVGDGLSLYRNQLGVEFKGFSGLVEDKLEQIDDLKLRKAKFNILGKDENSDEKQEKRIAYFKQNMNELSTLMEREVRQYLSYDFFVLKQTRVIDNYRTENTRWSLPINLGYAAVYNDNSNVDQLEDVGNTKFEGSPMVGLSIPLGNPYLNNKFWSNSSISAGVLLQNLEFSDTREMTGPVVDRPLYLAYGYKTAYFIRINAGTTILTEKGGSDEIEFGPFIGLSVEINLWLGLQR